MFNPNILADYASKRDPESSIPLTIRLANDDHTVTIFDLFPKAKYHFLVLPRVPFRLNATTEQATNDVDTLDLPSTALSSLTSLLSLMSTRTSSKSSPYPPQDNKEAVLGVLSKLKQASEEAVEMIQDEMIKTEGWAWDVNVGFHAVPSMNHLHLHIISSDLISSSLKTKKHYNSFDPTGGFFLNLAEVVRLVEDGGRELPSSPHNYELILKQPLKCFKCGESCKDVPTLKAHLQQEWEKEGKKALAKAAKERGKGI